MGISNVYQNAYGGSTPAPLPPLAPPPPPPAPVYAPPPMPADVMRLSSTPPAPAPVTGPAPAPAPGNRYGLLSTVVNALTGAFNAVKGLVHKLFAGNATSSAEFVKRYPIEGSAANVATFNNVWASQSAEAGAIAPGSSNKAAVANLQAFLRTRGIQVPQSGEYNVDTMNAVLQFKASIGQTEAFRFANGSAGVTPFIGAATRAAMQALNGGQPVI